MLFIVKQNLPNLNCSLSMSRIDAGAHRWEEKEPKKVFICLSNNSNSYICDWRLWVQLLKLWLESFGLLEYFLTYSQQISSSPQQTAQIISQLVSVQSSKISWPKTQLHAFPVFFFFCQEMKRRNV